MATPSYDPILEGLMAPGGAFEVRDCVIEGRSLRVFANAAPSLAAFINQGRQHTDKVFIVEPGLTLTFAEYFERVDRLADRLAAQRDCPQGEVVALAARNSASWMIAFSAIVLSGRVPALINSRGLGDTMLAGIDDAGARLLMADDKRLQQLRDAGCELPALSLDVLSEAGTSRSSEIDSRGHTGSTMAADMAPEDVAVLMYTSGTTGRAKAAALSHRAMVLGVMNTLLARRAILERMAHQHSIPLPVLQSQIPQASSLLIFPLFHTSGCSALFLTSLINGDKLVLLPRWDISAACQAIQDEKVTAMTAVPTMLWDLLNAPDCDKYDLSSLRSFSSGGQAIAQDLLRGLRAAFPKAIFGTGYGMTEANGSIAQAVGEEFLNRPESAGRILPMADVKVVDEQGQDLPPGAVSDIWVRSATLMNGYWMKGALTRPFKPGGWYASGDIGRVDAEGFVYIVDRKTDMVISGGENIYSAEVEQAFSGIDGVSEVAAFGIPDSRLGEVVILAAVSNHSPEVIRHAIAQRAEHALAAYKRPKDVYVRIEPLPRNAMNKIEKHKVRHDYLAGQGGRSQ